MHVKGRIKIIRLQLKRKNNTRSLIFFLERIDKSVTTMLHVCLYMFFLLYIYVYMSVYVHIVIHLTLKSKMATYRTTVTLVLSHTDRQHRRFGKS